MRLFVLLLVWVSLFGHQTGLSYLELLEHPDANIDVTYKKPLSDTRIGDITINYPSQCQQISTPNTQMINGFIITKYKLWCGKKGLVQNRIWVQGLVASDRGILVRYQLGDFVKKEVLRNKTPFILLDKKSNTFELMQEYILLGIHHILSGYDHLLFVLLVFLLARNLKLLLFSISAFTLSHSITLTCSYLDIIYLPSPLIESMIALSIIFLAKELLIMHDSFTKRHLAVVTFSFGLLHGFGFSSVLKDIGLPQGEIPLSLFSFNVGIELGQILFITVAAMIVYLLKKLGLHPKNYYHYLAYFAGSLASFWFIQRVFTF